MGSSGNLWVTANVVDRLDEESSELSSGRIKRILPIFAAVIQERPAVSIILERTWSTGRFLRVGSLWRSWDGLAAEDEQGLWITSVPRKPAA